MKILFLGTGAADYAPELKTTHKDIFDLNFRRSSSILIDDTFLVDCGDHTMNSIEIAKVDKKKIRNLVITHTHRDHCRKDLIEELAAVSGKLDVWCHKSIEGFLFGMKNCVLHPIDVKVPQEIDGFLLTALFSNHRTKLEQERTVHYIIEKGGKKLFYGCDGAWLLTDTFYYLMNRKFDMFVFDCTVGDYDGDFRMAEHNSIPMIRMMMKSMEKKGIFSDTCKIYMSHLARSLHEDHAVTMKKLAEENYLVAYDGLVENI